MELIFKNIILIISKFNIKDHYFIIEIIFHRKNDVIQYGGYITKIV